MRIGIISDTHIPSRSRELPTFVAKAFAGVDKILHAGDINDYSVLRALNAIAPTEAVAGNTDLPGVAESLGFELLLDLAGYRVGLTHGHLGRGKSTSERAFNTFLGRADVVVFGHSHKPLNRMRDGVLLLNPGSPTDKRRQPMYSVAILSLTKRVGSEILYFK
jgi:putative phosphoesterase